MDFRQIGGGSKLVTSFTDSFTRANATSVGPNWIYTAAYSGTQPMTSTVSVNGNALTFQDTSVNQVQSFPIGIVPIIGAPNLSGKTQFSQAQVVSFNDLAGTRALQCGPMVCCGLNTAAGNDATTLYGMGLDTSAGHLFAYVQKWFGGVYSANLIQSGNGTIAVGSIVRLSAQIGGSSVILTLSINGVSVGTFTDSSNPLLTGIPGMVRINWVSNASPGTGTSQFKNYACGKGL